MRRQRIVLGLVAMTLIASMGMGANPVSADEAPGRETSTQQASAPAPSDDELSDEELCDWVANEGETADEWADCMKWAATEIDNKPQTVTLDPIPPLIVGQSVTVRVSASSGLPVRISTTDGCRIVNDTLVAVRAGECVVGAEQGGNDQWFAAAASPVNVQVARASVVMKAEIEGLPGKNDVPWIKRGGEIKVGVQVKGLEGHAVIPSGSVQLWVDGDQVGSAQLVDGKAVVSAAPPKKLGKVPWFVKYSGDTGFQPKADDPRQVAIGAPEGKGFVEVTSDPAQGAIFSGFPVKFTASLYPAPKSDGKASLSFKWRRLGGQGQTTASGALVESAVREGQTTVAHTVRRLIPGEYVMHVEYTGSPLGDRVEAEDEIAFTVTSDRNGRARPASGAARSTWTVRGDLTIDPARAPESRVYTKTPTEFVVTIPGVNGRVVEVWGDAEGDKPAFIGTATAGANGVVTLPGIEFEREGVYLVYVEPDGLPTRHLRVRATDAPKSGMSQDEKMLRKYGAGIAKDFFKDIWGLIPGVKNFKGTLGFVSSSLFGLLDPPETDKLTPMKVELLNAITDTQKQIVSLESSVKALENTVENASCNIQQGQLGQARSTIKGLNDQYKTMVATAARNIAASVRVSGTPYVAAPDDSWSKWSADVLHPTAGAKQAADQFAIALGVQPDGSVSKTSLLRDCAGAYKTSWRESNKPLAEPAYYQSLWTTLNVVQDAQATAMVVFNEATNVAILQAWRSVAAVNPKAPADLYVDEIANLCRPGALDQYRGNLGVVASTEANGSHLNAISNLCANRELFFTETYRNMQDATLAAGLGYSMGGQFPGAVSTEMKSNGDLSNLLWITDLDKFTVSDDDPFNCGRLTSEKGGACGLAAGVGNTPFEKALPGPAPAWLADWRIANSEEWRRVLASKTAELERGGDRVFERMWQKGFFPEDKVATDHHLIVYTGDQMKARSDDLGDVWGLPGEFTIGHLDWYGKQWLYSWMSNGDYQCFVDTASPVADTVRRPDGADKPKVKKTLMVPYCRPKDGLSWPDLFLDAQKTGGEWHHVYRYGNVYRDIYEVRLKPSVRNWSNVAFYEGGQRLGVVTAVPFLWNWPRPDMITRFHITKLSDQLKRPAWALYPAGQEVPALKYLDAEQRNIVQYRWPVRDLAQVTCKPFQVDTFTVDGESAPTHSRTLTPKAVNVAGVPSMCGDDFAELFRARFE